MATEQTASETSMALPSSVSQSGRASTGSRTAGHSAVSSPGVTPQGVQSCVSPACFFPCRRIAEALSIQRKPPLLECPRQCTAGAPSSAGFQRTAGQDGVVVWKLDFDLKMCRSRFKSTRHPAPLGLACLARWVQRQKGHTMHITLSDLEERRSKNMPRCRGQCGAVIQPAQTQGWALMRSLQDLRPWGLLQPSSPRHCGRQPEKEHAPAFLRRRRLVHCPLCTGVFTGRKLRGDFQS